jgi:LPXTG-motif cell wall-anchored protein
MATSLRLRGTSVLALALASGVTLAVSVPAGAATTHAPAYYQGVASANVLSVALNLPTAPVSLPVLPAHPAVNLIGVTGNAVHNTLATGSKTTSEATSMLASGSLADLLQLTKVEKATLANPSASDPGQAVNADPIADLQVGGLTANVGQLTNTATANLLSGNVAKLGSLLDVKSAAGSATTLLSSLQSQVNQVSSTVTSQVNNALNQIGQALQQPGLSQQATQQLDQVQAAVQTVQDKINTILNNVSNTSVVSFKTLQATQSIAPNGNSAQSQAAANLLNLNVLNGLVTVEGFASTATAMANGVAGGASASFSGHKPIVAVGTPVITATLDETGINISDATGQLPAQVQDAVNTALSTLNGALNTLLNTLGVHLTFVPGHSTASPDGKFASATGPEYDIVVDNPTSSTPLALIGLGHGTTASVSAAQAPALHRQANPQAGKLPHTGANLPLIAGGGLAFLLGAAYLRRRVLV